MKKVINPLSFIIVLSIVLFACKKEKPQSIKIEKKDLIYPKHQWIIK